MNKSVHVLINVANDKLIGAGVRRPDFKFQLGYTSMILESSLSLFQSQFPQCRLEPSLSYKVFMRMDVKVLSNLKCCAI